MIDNSFIFCLNVINIFRFVLKNMQIKEIIFNNIENNKL